jgi:uncharacterized protein (DUF2336 family)
MSQAPTFNVEQILAAVSDWKLITQKAMRPEATRDEILLGLSNRDRDSRVRIAWSFVRQRRCERDILQRLADDPSRNVRRIVAGYPPTPVPILRQLSQDSSADVRRYISRRSGLNRELQTALARDQDWEVQRIMASNVAAHLTDLVVELSQHRDPWIRARIAERSHLPDHVIRELAADLSSMVRGNLAKNPTPPDVSLILAGDFYHDVAYPIALRDQLSVEEIRLLASHRSERIKATIAERTDLPHDVMSRLAQDQSSQVRQRIAAVTTNSRLLKKLATDSDIEVQYTVLTNPSSTVDVLKKVTRLRAERMRSALVQHPNASPELIEPYLSATELSLRCDARNAYLRLTGLPYPARQEQSDQEQSDQSPPTNPAVIYSLLDGDQAKDSVWPAASDTHLPLPVRIAILRSPELPLEVLRANADDRRAEIRIVIAERTDTPADLMAHLMTDRSWYVRQTLIFNPALPMSLLKITSKDDPDPTISKWAKTEYRRRYARGDRP